MPHAIAIDLQRPERAVAAHPVQRADDDTGSDQIGFFAVVTDIFVVDDDTHALGKLHFLAIRVCGGIAVGKAQNVAEEAVEIAAQFSFRTHAQAPCICIG